MTNNCFPPPFGKHHLCIKQNSYDKRRKLQARERYLEEKKRAIILYETRAEEQAQKEARLAHIEQVMMGEYSSCLGLGFIEGMLWPRGGKALRQAGGGCLVGLLLLVMDGRVCVCCGVFLERWPRETFLYCLFCFIKEFL